MYHFRYPLATKVAGYDTRLHRRRHDAPRDHARRHGRCRASRGRALHGAHQGRREGARCRSSTARSRSSPTNTPTPRRARVRSRSRPRTTSTTSRSASATTSRRSTCSMRSRATRTRTAPQAYRGLDRFEARKRVVADIEALGLLAKIEPTTHTVPHGDRSNVVIEPWLTDQWYVNAAELAKPAIAAVENGKTRLRARRTGRRPTSSGCATSSPGASRASSGGAIRFRRGTGPDGTRISSHDDESRAAQRLAGHAQASTAIG